MCVSTLVIRGPIPAIFKTLFDYDPLGRMGDESYKHCRLGPGTQFFSCSNNEPIKMTLSKSLDFQSKRSSTLRHFHSRCRHMKTVGERSTKSRGFSPGTPVSSYRKFARVGWD
jgi:hypothetical protein